MFGSSSRFRFGIFSYYLLSLWCWGFNIQSQSRFRRNNYKFIGRCDGLQLRRTQLFAADEGTSEPKTDNVGMFAAGDKVIPTKQEPIVVKEVDIVVSKSVMELQAEYLRLEAEKEEIIMSQTKIDEEKRRLQNIDNFILKLLDAPDLEQCVTANKAYIRKDTFFRLAELANAAVDPAERRGYFGLYDGVLAAVKKLDSNLFEEVTTDIQKDIAMELQQARSKAVAAREMDRPRSLEVDETVKVYDQVLQQWMQSVSPANNTFTGGDNNTLSDFPGPKIMRYPGSLPLEMLPMLLRAPEIPREDIETLKTKIFTPDLMNNTLFDFSSFLTTVRGTPTGDKTMTEVLEEARAKVAAVPGLADRVRILVLPDYQTRSPTASMEKYSGLKFDPVFFLISKEALPQKSTAFEYVGGALSWIGAFVTIFIYATDVNSLNSDFLAKALAGDASVVGRVLPLVGGILALQLVHDMGHFLTSRFHGVSMSLPVQLPSLQIGIYGSATRFLGFPKNRKELFDIAISGPFLGFVASLACTAIGLALTQGAQPADLAVFPEVPVGFFGSSLLLYQLTNVFLHISQLPDASTLVPIHPLVAIGVTGVFTNALNFMPIGRLDGGRVAMAVAGRQAANSIAFSTLILVGFSFLDSPNLVQLFWIIFVSLFQRTPDIPPEDDVTPVASDADDKNKGVAWFGRVLALGLCMFATAGTLLPQPQQPAAQQAAVTKAEQVEGVMIPGLQNLKLPSSMNPPPTI